VGRALVTFMKLKAISLWQPWACLVAFGAKGYETRSWPAPESLIGQRIAIHAAKRWTPALRRLSQTPLFAKYLDEAVHGPMVFGGIVAVATLIECVRVEHVIDYIAGTAEEVFGDYSHGRWAWSLSCVESFGPYLPCVGRQGIFTVEIPEEKMKGA